MPLPSKSDAMQPRPMVFISTTTANLGSYRCDAVICLLGGVYGHEPKNCPASAPHRWRQREEQERGA